ncbi:MAG TPA: S41 family peptidase [Pyrinomonadaceae bacterium]|nr:S41 family peptidase [Pyrinomonadaceae bacterium]
MPAAVLSQGTGTVASADRTDPTQSKPASGKKSVTVEQVNAEMREALALIEKNHVRGNKLDYIDTIKVAVDSMLHTLDPHSNFYDAKETEQFKTEQRSQYFGIGATIGDLSDEKGNLIATYIKATFDGAPAHRAGLRYGDKIVDVNGKSMLGKPFSEVRSHLRGERGTLARITVERLHTGKLETFDITRDAVSQPSISEAYMMRPGIGYIALRSAFNHTTYGEFVDAMRNLKAQGMQQLVLDLRDNGGGLVFQSVQIANTFLSNGQMIVRQRGRKVDHLDPYVAVNRNPERMPLVVLVNRSSASASEILSGALQDHDRALIVGEKTYAKGLVQNPFTLADGSMLMLVIAKFETPSGRLIQRDYSNGGLYNYLTDGGSLKDEDTPAAAPTGPGSKTDAGRDVYSGGGITPDVAIKPQMIAVERVRVQNRMTNPLLAFSLDLIAGRVKGFENLLTNKPITFGYDLKPTDFLITDEIYSAYKKFASEKYKIAPAVTDSEKEFVQRILRTELVTASYGMETSQQVFNEYDQTLLKSFDLLPQAKLMAIEALKPKAQPANRP